MTLSKKKCVPCEGGVPKLDTLQQEQFLEHVPEWQILKNEPNMLQREFSFSNFQEAMDFANKITEIAEAENHHPDLHISWGKVIVEIHTHAIKGLSENDFILAAKIDSL